MLRESTARRPCDQLAPRNISVANAASYVKAVGKVRILSEKPARRTASQVKLRNGHDRLRPGERRSTDRTSDVQWLGYSSSASTVRRYSGWLRSINLAKCTGTG